MDQPRRFVALRRRVNALQQEQYTIARVIENTDWRGDHSSELSSNQARLITIEDEISDIEFLFHAYELNMERTQAMILMPQTAALIAAIVLITFVLMTIAASWLAGTFNVAG